MQLFCPACQAAFSGSSRCPKCGGLLLMPQEAADPLPTTTNDSGPIRPTTLGRVIVGTLSALGLYLGLREAATGLLMTTDPDSAWWLSTAGLATVFGLQAVAVAFGAVLTAAGRGIGFPLGLVVGGICGGLFLAAEVGFGAPPRDLVFYTQLPVLGFVGGIAGWVGGRVWAGVPVLDIHLPISTNKLSSMALGLSELGNTGRPTAWVRVFIGAAIIVGGVSVAEKIRQSAQKGSAGLLKVQSSGQGRFISWQLATFAVLAGGVVAAAGTGAGLRHGLIAGFLGAAGVVGMAASEGNIGPGLTYALDKLGFGGAGPADAATLVAAGGVILFTAMAGGWLGGQVFLPLAPVHMRNRRLRGGD